MLKDAVNYFGLGDEGDNPHRRLATPGTLQGIDFENAPEKLRPSAFCLAYGLGLRVDHCERLFCGVAVGLAAGTPLA